MCGQQHSEGKVSCLMAFYEIYVCSWAFLRVVQDKVEIFCELLTLHGMFVSGGILAISFLKKRRVQTVSVW